MYRFRPPDKERPVLILTRNSSLPLLNTVTIATITSTIRRVDSEVLLDESDGMKRACAVNLHNITTVTPERLGRRVGVLRPESLEEVCAALRFSLGCEEI